MTTEYKNVALRIAEWMEEQLSVGRNTRPSSWFVKLYDEHEEYMGETSPLSLLVVLLHENTGMDLYSEEAGGAVPVDISVLHHVELYIG
jgi:hypothetical protein